MGKTVINNNVYMLEGNGLRALRRVRDSRIHITIEHHTNQSARILIRRTATFPFISADAWVAAEQAWEIVEKQGATELFRPLFDLGFNQLQGMVDRNECNQCGRRFRRDGDLARHISGVHEKSAVLKCDYPKCGRRFNRKDHYRGHLRDYHHDWDSESATFSRCKKCLNRNVCRCTTTIRSQQARDATNQPSPSSPHPLVSAINTQILNQILTARSAWVENLSQELDACGIVHATIREYLREHIRDEKKGCYSIIRTMLQRYEDKLMEERGVELATLENQREGLVRW